MAIHIPTLGRYLSKLVCGHKILTESFLQICSSISYLAMQFLHVRQATY